MNHVAGAAAATRLASVESTAADSAVAVVASKELQEWERHLEPTAADAAASEAVVELLITVPAGPSRLMKMELSLDSSSDSVPLEVRTRESSEPSYQMVRFCVRHGGKREGHVVMIVQLEYTVFASLVNGSST